MQAHDGVDDNDDSLDDVKHKILAESIPCPISPRTWLRFNLLLHGTKALCSYEDVLSVMFSCTCHRILGFVYRQHKYASKSTFTRPRTVFSCSVLFSQQTCIIPHPLPQTKLTYKSLWDSRFCQRYRWRYNSSGMLYILVGGVIPDVSKNFGVSNFKVQLS